LKAIEEIRKKFYDKEYEFAIPHFFEEMADDELEFSDIERVIKTGKIRKKFTHDPRGTRYEIVGCSHDEREVAVICRIKITGKLLFITTYAI
jgi:superfamily II helicase